MTAPGPTSTSILVPNTVDLNEVVRQTAFKLARFQDEGIHLLLDLWLRPVEVVAEPGALDRVVMNLALNACDAMPDGGVLTIETAIAHAWRRPIASMRPGPYARLRVTDNGCGMTPDVTHRMFERFYTTKEHGTGLGLHSVAVTIEQLQGTISVESAPRRGTSVTIMLPLPPLTIRRS